MDVRRRPWLTVQPSVAAVLRDVQAQCVDTEDVWVSAYSASKSVHGSLTCERKGSLGTLRARSDATVWQVQATAQPDVWDVKVQGDVEMTAQVHVPRVQHTWEAGSHAPTRLAMSEQRWAIGGAEGQLYTGVWPGGAEAPSVPPVSCEGHASDLTSVRFFPSGEVLVSTSLDMRARIFSAIDGSCPRTFQGHTRAITGSAILGRGRHIATGSLDQTVRVWDVGRGATVQQWTREAPVTALEACGATASTPEAPIGALLAGGQQAVHAWDVREAPSEAWALALPPNSGPVSAMWAHEFGVLVGTHQGVVAVWDVRAPTTPLEAWTRSQAGITDVYMDAQGALVATSDGLPGT
ncbi:hypothetical protein MEQU1_000900 [Malassezia equina]|uniref:Uncharacterized protein n=1 Tax=Malassezia equina TaxID=1381935 RepID=A0AAF0ECX3_9BASI|nr:hypothetical protein MEQU1_000900 [Malassezia equina]